MAIAQLIQSSPAKVNELFAKLAETGEGALKTREKLLADLREELELHARLEEQNLFPALRKHKETKDLVPEALNDNKRVRALLAELDGMPKDDANFLNKVAELKKVFQQHIRDEKKELLPAVKKALSDEEAGEITRRIEAGRAEVEDARREQAAQHRAEVRREREEAERLREASVAMARSAGSAAESGLRIAETGAQASRQVADVAGRTAQQANAAVSDAVRTAFDSARPAIDGLQVAMGLPQVAAGAMSETGRTVMEWMERTSQSATRRSEGMARCSTPREFSQVQGRFMQEALEAWYDASSRMVEISMRASQQLFEPIERQTQRMKEAAGRQR